MTHSTSHIIEVKLTSDEQSAFLEEYVEKDEPNKLSWVISDLPY